MLNAAQIAARAGKIGASDIGIIVSGDAVKINNLWLEKIGDKQPDDLSDVWIVQLGEASEPKNLDRYERMQRQAISRRGEVVTHYAYDWACCTLDGWIDELRCPIECKLTSGHEPLDPVILDRYRPQCEWQMEVTGAEQCALSVALGTAAPVVTFIKRDADYAGQLLERGWTFIQHVRNRTPPVDLPTVPLPVDATKAYDMTGHNQWASSAHVWLELRDSAAAYDDAAKILKSLVPPDAKRCFGHDVQITRSRVGYLSLREKRDD